VAPFPSGEVAFLFTDIEGSTRLWERDAAAMWRALEQHHTLLRDAIRAHGGVPFKTVGDAFQAAFASAPKAVTAAAQRRLAAAQWPETGPIRVRMAVHVGEARPDRGDYTAGPVMTSGVSRTSGEAGGRARVAQLVTSKKSEGQRKASHCARTWGSPAVYGTTTNDRPW
jgi:hypothetical protein